MTLIFQTKTVYGVYTCGNKASSSQSSKCEVSIVSWLDPTMHECKTDCALNLRVHLPPACTIHCPHCLWYSFHPDEWVVLLLALMNIDSAKQGTCARPRKVRGHSFIPADAFKKFDYTCCSYYSYGHTKSPPSHKKKGGWLWQGAGLCSINSEL